MSHLGDFFRTLTKRELKPVYDYAERLDPCHDTGNIVSVTKRAVTNEFVSGVEAIEWTNQDTQTTMIL